jgi:hypothetical protein
MGNKPAQIARPAGSYTIPMVGRRTLLCRRCGSRDIDTVPYWNDTKIAGVQETYSYPAFGAR